MAQCCAALAHCGVRESVCAWVGRRLALRSVFCGSHGNLPVIFRRNKKKWQSQTVEKQKLLLKKRHIDQLKEREYNNYR